ncbi:MAG: pyridoxamine 5'-phosphate oxidase, partial [Gemmatimonadota bacterium]
MSSLGDLRRDYARAPLERDRLHADPLEQFRLWF